VGERFFGPEDGRDLIHTLKVGAQGHLLVQLRGLGEAGRAPTVVQAEAGGAALAGPSDEAGRVDFLEAQAVHGGPEQAAHGGLQDEDRVHGGDAQVDHARVEAGVGGHGGAGGGGGGGAVL